MSRNVFPGLSSAMAEKVEHYLVTHRRIVKDFERSLANARHFIKLAELALEKEPANAVQMLNQIREVDLLGHLTQQLEEFQSLSASLPAALPQQEEQTLARRLSSVRERYETLIREAEQQVEDIDKILDGLNRPT
jgi:ferritin-like metal-binding protein YciE